MVTILVDAHLLTLTISTAEIVQRAVRVGRETRMQRERVMRTREIPTTRHAGSLMASFTEVNKIFAAADIEFKLRNWAKEPIEAPNGAEKLDDDGFLMLANSFPMKTAVNLLLVHRFQGSEGGASVESWASVRLATILPTTPLPMNSGTCLGFSIKATYGI